MKTPFASKSLSPPARRRAELAIAVAQERLLSTHIEHALKLIKGVGDQVPFDSALEIYTRLLRLSPDEARIITTRALARLGEHAAESETWPELMAEAAQASEEKLDPRTIFGQLKQRLRGRVNDTLRRWIEVEAARTEVALIESHIESALQFVEILEKEVPFTEAVELYLGALDVRDSVAEVVYYLALTRLGERLYPEPPPPAEAAIAALPILPEERRLRVVEREGA